MSDRYLIESVTRACEVMECFGSDGEVLRLSDVVARTGLTKSTAFRILFTLQHRGILEAGGGGYRLMLRSLKRRKYRFGYGAQSSEFAFSRAVAESIQRTAFAEGIDLVVLDNRYSPRTAVRNADIFVREHVDLVIDFQTDQHSAQVISSKLLEAHIPLIAVEIPHPGATYYGADNYRAGVMAGTYLGKWCQHHWKGQLDQVILLGLPVAGPVPHSRLTGLLAGLREELPLLTDSQVEFVDGNGRYEASLRAARKLLRTTKCRKVLVGAVNDPSAIGALRAFEEAGRSECCAVVGQNASAEARAEMRLPGSRLIASVAYYPERYGEAIIPLALSILRHEKTPPAVFVKHQLITRENVNRQYPNEDELSRNELDAILSQHGMVTGKCKIT